MKERLRLLVVSAILVLCVFSGGSCTKRADAASLTKVPEGYKAIKTIDDLRGINNDTSGNYILMNDIDLTEATMTGGTYDTGNGWEPLNVFNGKLDGNGYCIKGMHTYGNKYLYVGLFWGLDGASVTNLGIKECDIDVDYDGPGYSYVGALAGRIENSTVNNCYTTGNIKAARVNGKTFVGAIVGGVDAKSENIAKCYSTVNFDTTGCKEYAIAKNSRSVDCYFAGSSKNSGMEFAGSNCFYLSGSISSGVEAKELTQAQMKSKNYLTNWDFENTWYIDRYCKYKYPQLASVPQIKLIDMKMTASPEKITYSQSEELSLKGAVIKLEYEDGSIEDVSPDDNDDFKTDYNSLRIGKQDIKITYLECSMECSVVVNGVEVSEIELSCSNVNIPYGKEYVFTAVTKPAEALDNSITWTVTDAIGKEVSITDAYISKNGEFMGNKVGEYIVKAKVSNGIYKTCFVNVTNPIAYIVPKSEQINMECGESKEIELTKSPEESKEDIVWKSSDEKIATVDNGVVTAKLPGKVEITAEAESGAKARCYVTVMQDISLCKATGLIDQVYTAKEITLENLKVEGIAGILTEDTDYTVDYDKNIEVGTADVTITGCGFYKGELKCKFNIVLGSLDKAKISNTSINLAVKKTKKLKITGALGYTVKWSSKSKTIATVDKNGKVTAKKAGTTYITAKVGNKTFKCKVVVK